ncbi:glycosyltransferase family 4 protein [Fibrella arboris]|uniref:glycosyltransferase family 4 protein n=1 Tax=Fibrella arboris TaxID=3242486 RepID=UPI00351FF1DB
MIIVSCSGKFHAFNLAEQLAEHGQLSGFYTRYAWQRNTLMRRFVSRVDKEQIPLECIHTHIPLAVAARLNLSSEYTNSHMFDKWVAGRLQQQAHSYKVFIGWSGMSLHSLRQAKRDGKLAIVERGSSHICFQDRLLRDEYARFGLSFSIDSRVVSKECQEYEEADFISIPSQFVKRTFLQYGVAEHKLLVNPYGTSQHFSMAGETAQRNAAEQFTIVYVGSLTIRKGLIYLFEALHKLPIPESNYQVWFIGYVADELKETIQRYQRPNWTFWGHVNHYELPAILARADVGVQPSLEEGLSMVIPQLLAAGVPVVATDHTGGEDLIEDGMTGYIVPIRDVDQLASRLHQLYADPGHLNAMKANTIARQENRSWAAYGEQYLLTLKNCLSRVIDSQ